MIKPSKYQPEVDRLMQKYQADGVFIVVWRGLLGSGSASTIERRLLSGHAAFLRSVADELDAGDMTNVSSITVVE